MFNSTRRSVDENKEKNPRLNVDVVCEIIAPWQGFNSLWSCCQSDGGQL